jgi:hypothetical protein
MITRCPGRVMPKRRNSQSRCSWTERGRHASARARAAATWSMATLPIQRETVSPGAKVLHCAAPARAASGPQPHCGMALCTCSTEKLGVAASVARISSAAHASRKRAGPAQRSVRQRTRAEYVHQRRLGTPLLSTVCVTTHRVPASSSKCRQSSRCRAHTKHAHTCVSHTRTHARMHAARRSKRDCLSKPSASSAVIHLHWAAAQSVQHGARSGHVELVLQQRREREPGWPWLLQPRVHAPRGRRSRS